MEQNKDPLPKIGEDKKPVVDVTYAEPRFEEHQKDVNVEDVFGQFHMVTAVPTYVPKSFKDGIAFNTASSVMYYYDFTNNQWRTVGASILAGRGTMSAGVLDVTHAGITSNSICVATRHGSADSSAFPQIATGYTSGTTMRIFEGSFTKTWDIDYIIYY